MRGSKPLTVLLASASALVFLHWLVTQTEPLSPARNELGFLAFLVFVRETNWPGYSSDLTVVLSLLAATGLAASALSILLAVKASDRIETRRLALALALGAASVAHFYFITTNPSLRTAAGWHPASPWRVPMDFLAYLAAALSPLLVTRFFLDYPRAATEEDWQAHSRHSLESAREDIRRGAWHYRLLPASIRERFAAPGRKDGWLWGVADDTQAVVRAYRMVRLIKSPAVLLAACAWALTVAAVDWIDATGAMESSALAWLGKGFTSMLYMLFMSITMSLALESMKLRDEGAFADDRRKVDWIRSTLLVGGLLAAGVFPLTMAAVYLALPHLAEATVFIPAGVLMVGPVLVPVILLSLAFLLALALSIFYRGAVDPRLAARKVTLLGALGLIVTFLFLLLERIIAAKLAAWLNLSPDSGALVAGAAVASTIVPVRNRTEKVVNAIVGRWLPLDSVIQGERRTLAVAISDLSGYTALSSRDEKQALLLAALLQRLAQKLTREHGGRIVKSMGDAVLFAFDDAGATAKVLLALHRDFQPAASQLGLQPLAVHSGAHWGEVTVAADGDIYGQTVNVAARIQGSADTGQVVVSGAFADLVRGAAPLRELGPRQFKNVADPIPCEELGAA